MEEKEFSKDYLIGQFQLNKHKIMEITLNKDKEKEESLFIAMKVVSNNLRFLMKKSN